MELISLGDRGQDMVRAVAYERQSHKSETDSQASPQMQRSKSVAYIKSQDNWTLIDTDYSDVGLSGYDPNVFRPGLERLMEDARARKFDVVVIYMLSRLTRQGAAEALRIQQELAKYGVALVSTQEPFINTSDDNPFGVAFFALIAGLAHQESKNKSKFIKDAFAELKAKGSHSSGPVPYGFKAEAVQVDKLTIRTLSPGPSSDVDELGPESLPADAVRFMIAEAQDGNSVNKIATSLTDKGVLTSLASKGEKGEKVRASATAKRKGGDGDSADLEWSASVVLRILRDPRLAGFAIGPVDPSNKRRTIQRDEGGQPVRPHEGFMTPHDWYKLQQLLDGRKPVARRDRSGTRTFLGSWGILKCGKCTAGMTVSWSEESYVCNLRRTVTFTPAGETTSVSVPRHTVRTPMTETNDVVAQRVWARLGALDPSDPEDVEWLAAAAERYAVQGADPEAAAELSEQEAQLEHVQQSITDLDADREAYAGPTARKAFQSTMAKYVAHEARCMAKIEELKSSATTATRIPVDEWFDDGEGNPFAPGGLWSRWDVDERRAFLSSFVDHVTVAPAESKRGDKLTRTDGRVEVHWATLPESEEDDQVTA